MLVVQTNRAKQQLWATWITLLALGMVLLMIQPAWADGTSKAIKRADETFEDGKLVWIDKDTFGASEKAITKQIKKYPELDIRVVVLGQKNEHADIEQIATRLRRTFNGTVMVFTPSNMYLSSDQVSQAEITNAIVALADDMANETNIAIAVGKVAHQLTTGSQATSASSGEEGSSTVIWVVGMLVAAGIIVLVMRFSTKLGDSNSRMVRSEAELAQEKEQIEQLTIDASVLRDHISTLIIDVSDKMLLNQDKELDQKYSRYLSDYERYSSAVSSIVSVETGKAAVSNLERVRDGLQEIMAELL